MTDVEHPAPPGHVNSEAADLWRATVEAYDLEPHELRLLRLACEALTRADQARKALRRHGLVWVDRLDNVRPRPEVAIEVQNRASFAALVKQLQLPDEEEETPAAAWGRPTRSRNGTYASRKAS